MTNILTEGGDLLLTELDIELITEAISFGTGCVHLFVDSVNLSVSADLCSLSLFTDSAALALIEC